MTVGQIFTKYICLYLYLGLFFENRKNWSHTGSKWRPVNPDMKDDPLTRWPNDPVPCLQQTQECSKLRDGLLWPWSPFPWMDPDRIKYNVAVIRGNLTPKTNWICLGIEPQYVHKLNHYCGWLETCIDAGWRLQWRWVWHQLTSVAW